MLRHLILTAAMLFICCPVRPQTLAGQVVEDHSGVALPSANVQITRIGDRFLAADLETDRDGRFRADGLPAGQYRLDVSKPNYATTKVPVTLSAAGSNTTTRLIKRGVISGIVRDAQNQPITGVIVLALPKPPAKEPIRPAGRVAITATTDATGGYRLHNLPPGQYVVAATYGASTRAMGASGRASTPAGLGSGFLYYPSNSRPDSLDVAGGEEFRNIDFNILATPMFSIAGKVELPAPKTPFIVALINMDQPALSAAITDANQEGIFSFTGIPSGSYGLVASSSGNARNGAGFLLPDKPIFGSTRVEVAGKNVDGITITPDATRSVTFSLRTSGSCAPSVQVELTSLEDLGMILGRTVEVKSGQPTVVNGLAPSRYAVASSADTSACYVEAESILDLSEGAPVSPIEILTAAASTLRGKLDTNGQPSSGFTIALMPEQEAATIEFSPLDAQSNFTFTSLRPGRYRIGAFRQGQRIPEITKMLSLEVRGGSNVEIELAALPEARQAEVKQ